MSTSSFGNHEEEQIRRKLIMNETRPSPLKITRESHSIQKRQPVIIYTHSPKIIHTQAPDFMGLVQKLTGMSRSEDEMTHVPFKSQNRTQLMNGENNDVTNKCNNSHNHDDNESASVMTDENCVKDDVINGFVGTRLK